MTGSEPEEELSSSLLSDACSAVSDALSVEYARNNVSRTKNAPLGSATYLVHVQGP